MSRYTNQQLDRLIELVKTGRDKCQRQQTFLTLKSAHVPRSGNYVRSGNNEEDGKMAIQEANNEVEGKNADMKDQIFVIWSWQHMAWWAPRWENYTRDLAKAGRYTWEEAADITVGHIPAGEEVAMLEAEAMQRGRPKNYAEAQNKHDATELLAAIKEHLDMQCSVASVRLEEAIAKAEGRT